MPTTAHLTRVNTRLLANGVNLANLSVNVLGTGSPALSLILIDSYNH